MLSLRTSVIGPLLTQNAVSKAQGTLALNLELPIDIGADIPPPAGIPGRPIRPTLVLPTAIKKTSLKTLGGRAALLHALAHIEFNAIDLALDIVWRFSGMPEQFYRDWVVIAKEEAHHFNLLRDHLLSLGFDYGDFDAHNTLWEMAEKTKDDVLARVALVPRTLEARGLDASPAVKNKLVSVGDMKAGEILALILKDEIGHVSTGNHWYRWICNQRNLDPISTYAELITKYDAPRLRPPFNLEARRLAGFDEDELRQLLF
ncbi:MAG: ferritin-like domain-containing protein [Pseudomonadota bacterium]